MCWNFVVNNLLNEKTNTFLFCIMEEDRGVEDMEEKKKNWMKEHKMSIFVIVSTVLMLIGLSYAWLQITLRGNKELTLVAAGTLYLELDDSMAGGITIESAEPVLDEVGKSGEGYTFTLENKGKIASDYTIYLDDLPLTDETRMNDSFIKYQLVRDGNETIDLLNSIGENPNRILDSGTITAGRKYTYTLKMWIDSSATNEVMGTVFKGQLRIEAMQSQKKLATEVLLAKTNEIGTSYETVSDDEKKEMFTFTHTAGVQQSGWSAEELKDYRYIGPSPNNYVTFNGETWRMIGVFTVEDERGRKEKRIKLIREESLGNYSWDNKIAGDGSSSSSNGSNDWTDSRLKDVLNSGAYYNRTKGTCPAGQNNTTIACDFSSNGLTPEAKSMLASTKWYLGAVASSYNNDKANEYYRYERGTEVYSGRALSWIGEVGMVYPSDYGYATSGSSCLNTVLYNYSSSCASTDWLYTSLINQWTITPGSDDLYYAFRVSSSGTINGVFAYDTNIGVRPSVYLKSSVSISSGDGSRENPYQLKI